MLSAQRANRQLVGGVLAIGLLAAGTAMALTALDGGSDTLDTSGAAAPPDTAPTPATTPGSEPQVPTPPFDEAEAEQMLGLLTLQTLRGTPTAALPTVAASGDQRFVSVLIELMRSMEIGLIPADLYTPVIVGLQELTGEEFVGWPDWVAWYAATELTPLPGFQDWKADLLAAIDPGFGEFIRGQPATVRVEEVVWGGVRVDGIPALDQARQIRPEQADYISESDLVFGVSINQDHRAYPLRIMDSHEMANDVVGGIPVSLAYCTLCGAGILYDGRLGEVTYTFGSSGLLMRSNKLMYDRNTRSLWNQLTGRPVLGPLAGEDIELIRFPVVVTTWADWLTAHPDTKVLDIETGFNRDYEPGSSYGGYYAAPDPMFPVGGLSEVLRPKDRVYALLLDDIPVAYPIDIVIEEMVVNDQVGDTPLVLVAPDGRLRDKGTDRPSGIDVVWQAGAEVRAFEAGAHIFSQGVDPDTLVDEVGVVWEVTEDALVSAEGESLGRLPGHLSYWFGWFSYFPRTLVYGVDA
ncbi:MAG: DUF3179 domain-containing protein [Acidimicrobiia bacterium]